jgi:hypothetical protein
MDSFISEDMKLAVKKGAYWMDENHPGWASNIKLNELDMGSCEKCIIGQSIRNMDFFAVIEDVAGSDYMVEWAETHGFDAPTADLPCVNFSAYDQELYARYHKLDTLWTEEVHKRLG